MRQLPSETYVCTLTSPELGRIDCMACRVDSSTDDIVLVVGSLRRAFIWNSVDRTKEDDCRNSARALVVASDR